MQNELLEYAKQEIKILWENTAEGKHIKTGDIRKLSSKLFRKVSDKNIDNVFRLCEEFLEQRTWEMGVIAFDWAYKMQKIIQKMSILCFMTGSRNMCVDGETAMIFAHMLLGSSCGRISLCFQMLLSGRKIMTFGCAGLRQ